jgi:hypothetical protein
MIKSTWRQLGQQTPQLVFTKTESVGFGGRLPERSVGSSPACGMDIWRRTDAASTKCRRWSETACASRRWVKPAYAGAESKPSNSARARNACEHAIAFVVPPERLSKVGCHLSIAQNVPAAVMLLPASLQAQIAELQDSVSCRVPEVSRPIARSTMTDKPNFDLVANELSRNLVNILAQRKRTSTPDPKRSKR